MTFRKVTPAALKVNVKKFWQVRTCSLACLSTNLGAFCPMVVHLPSEKSILPYFFRSQGGCHSWLWFSQSSWLDYLKYHLHFYTSTPRGFDALQSCDLTVQAEVETKLLRNFEFLQKASEEQDFWEKEESKRGHSVEEQQEDRWGEPVNILTI